MSKHSVSTVSRTGKLKGRVTDAKGRALAGVPVSNGESIVLTDKDGGYLLSVDPRKHTHVFVTVPAGWSAAGRFYRSAEDWLSGDRDFRLSRAKQSARRVHFTVITDLHHQPPPMPANTAWWLTRELRHIQSSCRGSQFTFATGDLTDWGKMKHLRELSGIFDGLDRPVFLLFGNHDANDESKKRTTDWPWFRNYLQTMSPTYYSLEWGPCHFTVMTNEDRYFNVPALRARNRWLGADLRLAKSRGLIPVLVTHCPPSPKVAGELSRRGVRLVIHGHWHSLRHYRVGKMEIIGLPSMTFGGIDMMPRGYLDVRIEDERTCCLGYVPLGSAWRGPARKTAVATVWQRKVADYFHLGGPVMANGRLFVAANRDLRAKSSSVLCLDADSGKTIWQADSERAVRHAPLLWRGQVFAVTQTGQILCLAQEDGSVIWRRQLNGYPHRWINGSPGLVDDRLVIAGTLRGGLEAFDGRSGRRAW